MKFSEFLPYVLKNIDFGPPKNGLRRQYSYLAATLFLRKTKNLLYVFWPWFSHFKAFWAEIVHGTGSSAGYYLPIGHEKSKFLIIFGKLLGFGGKMGVATTHIPNGLGTPIPTKKLLHWVDLSG